MIASFCWLGGRCIRGARGRLIKGQFIPAIVGISFSAEPLPCERLLGTVSRGAGLEG